MRRITLTLLIGALVLLSAARVTAAPSAPAFPFKPGTTWVYRHVMNEGPGKTDQEGTLTIFYRGEATYRGKTYHYVESSTTLLPQLSERDYMVWSAGVLRTAVIVLFEGSNALEILLDRPYSFAGPAETVSGIAQLYQNAIHQGSTPWSYTTTNEGTSKVTVPAGTFMTTVHTGRFRLGMLDQVFRVYAVGPREVRVELDSYRQGNFANRSTFDLLSGPVSPLKPSARP